MEDEYDMGRVYSFIEMAQIEAEKERIKRYAPSSKNARPIITEKSTIELMCEIEILRFPKEVLLDF